MERLKRWARILLRSRGFDLLPLSNLGFQDQKNLLPGGAQAIVDIGGATGKTAKIYRELFPAARLYILEPHPDSFRKLVSSTQHDQSVHPFNLAAADAPGRYLLNLNRSADTSSLLKAHSSVSQWLAQGEAELSGTVEVNAVTLDQFCLDLSIEHIDVLKLDVQGGELMVLRGATRLLTARSISLIYTEVSFVEVYRDQPLFHDLVVFLNRFGYRLHNLYDFALKMNTGRLMWCDALFVQSGSP